MREILCIGDSITQRGFEANRGWVSQLANTYLRRADVINRGCSGYNTRWIVAMLDDAALTHEIVPKRMREESPLFVTVFLGANDAADDFHAVPLEEYAQNMARIVSFVRDECRVEPRCIFVLSPPAVDAEAWMVDRQRLYGAEHVTRPNRSLERTKRYAAAAGAVAAELGASFCDLMTPMLAMEPASQWKALLCDGLHLSDGGNDLVFNTLLAAVLAAFPELHPEELPMPVPHHSAHNPANKEPLSE